MVWRWYSIAGVLLIAFHGCCRPGEVLRAVRSQLVLPVDLGQATGPGYLRIQKPKPGRRGMGRIQHAKISDLSVVRLLALFFKDLGIGSALVWRISQLFSTSLGQAA